MKALIEKLTGLFSSPRTSLAGLSVFILAFAHLLKSVAPLIDGNAETVADWNEIVSSLTEVAAALGLMAARDNQKTSEDVGAKTKRK